MVSSCGWSGSWRCPRIVGDSRIISGERGGGDGTGVRAGAGPSLTMIVVLKER